jgi:hypothetical protein
VTPVQTNVLKCFELKVSVCIDGHGYFSQDMWSDWTFSAAMWRSNPLGMPAC